ncbi:hypothetical protein M0805_000429 [Coniferiporia weirii]|nr:hypothetical protein M0805_000429 [Coniferiporia weirii]
MAGDYSSTPWVYVLVRLLSKFLLSIFYGTIVVENADLIPGNGKPCIFCANHSNSVTDAILLVCAVPFTRRNLIRLTAKATLYGKRTLTSWLVESSGTVPLKRRNDSPDTDVDNSESLEKLKQVLEQGDAVCLFPEGVSRFHPALAPLKTGVARLISDVLTRNKDDPAFEIYLQTCSITYMHRQHFRSDVLITFHPPTPFSPKANPELIAPVDFTHIRTLTARMQRQLASGTFDAPSWGIIRAAKLAARMYAPLGTSMSLGAYVRVVRAFVEAFKRGESEGKSHDAVALAGSTTSGKEKEPEDEDDDEQVKDQYALVNALQHSLKEYQDELSYLGVKDDRIRRPLTRIVILRRIVLRLLMLALLLPLALPGLILWSPIFIAAERAASRIARGGPIWDTWDKLVQAKLVAGLAAGLGVWALCVVLTFPFAFITAPAVPALMWMTLRWLEDGAAAGRALRALAQLLILGPRRLGEMRARRETLYARVMQLAVEGLGLPADPETYFTVDGGREKGRVRGRWEGKVKYFSMKRRRKRDWNETLKLYDVVDYPEDSL